MFWVTVFLDLEELTVEWACLICREIIMMQQSIMQKSTFEEIIETGINFSPYD